MSIVKGFKATLPNMTCRDYQFGIGKFKHMGIVNPCNSGFHFCKEITDVFTYYNADCRIFEVIGSGTIIDKEDKTVCSDIEFVREINYADYVDHKWRAVRCNVAFNKQCLDVLVDDEDPLVRRAVAASTIPKYMDKLINDPDAWVRKSIASYGHGLDKLIDDPNVWVRETVARKGYGLDKLISDESHTVRMAVANQGYGLDILLKDTHSDVRCAVAYKGYGLDVLLKDPTVFVRLAATTASRQIKSKSLFDTIQEYISR